MRGVLGTVLSVPDPGRFNDAVDLTVEFIEERTGSSIDGLEADGRTDDGRVSWRRHRQDTICAFEIVAQVPVGNDLVVVTAELTAADQITVSVRVDLLGMESSVPPAVAAEIGRDLLAVLLKRLPCHDAGSRVTVHPKLVVDEDELAALTDLLLSSDRQLPVLVISPSANGEPELDSMMAAERFVGMVHVYEIANRDLTWAMTDVVGPKLSVFAGAVRLYWPNMRVTDDGARHRFWTRNLIAAAPHHVLRDITELAVAATLIHWPEHRAIDQLRGDTTPTVEPGLLTLPARPDQPAPAEWIAWADTVEQLAEQAGINVFRPPPTPQQPDQPATVAAVAAQFFTSHRPAVLYLDRAAESAETSSYDDLEKFEHALGSIAEAGSDLARQNVAPDKLMRYFATRGVRYAASYPGPQPPPVTVDGLDLPVGPHVKLGSGSNAVRVHLAVDPRGPRLVIWHIGRDLPQPD